MSFASEVLTYQDALATLGDRRKHVLLGNGFSIACDPVFKYGRLYDAAVSAGLSPRAQNVFDYLGTSNFEGVMRLLDDAHWVAETYELVRGRSQMLDDVDIVKKTLVDAIANSHLEHTGKVPDEKKAAALEFLSPYYNVFTTNYDLLVYWVNMHRREGPIWGDGFREDEDEPDSLYVVFSERLGGQRGMFYLHGALHLYTAGGELRKHTWKRTGTPLTHLIKAGLANKEYPMFVAEGSAKKKLEQIQRNGYLWYALDKLARIEGPLVVFGLSLGDSDSHITQALADNVNMPAILVGLHGDPKSAVNQAIHASVAKMMARRQDLVKRRHRGKTLEVVYYDSATAKAWG
ncbi:conserved hypothetical protein [Anaeromyxobacter dehalogenans 2CP-1]|uniref:DUF4917 domain-containing protein n=1 Tax=Anaeromyxobacter dehalogenans (strain ATCC BAA-258 / DSM 21875 / 2CP-1) TaxID=455488 RepID=B8JFA4_ANAD2|nr:DUF4917 family protein [Anaeromyxobacter dehalogenans]ACL64461.1 conserved hypothetical protein [Anaeromyxobacter dehalogenans 2CP-1]